jgi:hypothetical protein
VPDLNSCSRSGAPSGGGVALPALIARAQRLIDTPRPVGGYPLAWHVEAKNVGDLTAIAAAALRGSGSARPMR